MAKKKKKIDPLQLIEAEFGREIKPFTKMQPLNVRDVPNTDLVDLNQFNNPLATNAPNPKNKINYGDVMLQTLLGINAILPPDRVKAPVVRPEQMNSFNPNPYGTGSQAIAKYGLPVEDPGPRDKYYENSAKLAYYKGVLNNTLKSKNPKAYDDYFKGLVDLRKKGMDTSKYVQDTPYNEYLTPDEVRKTLGKEYDSYLESLKTVNAYNVKQGMQPLYGDIEGSNDLSSLNYGRRFASLMVNPGIVQNSPDRNKIYKRDYSYDPKKGVTFKEEGDMSLMPDFLKPNAKFEKGGSIKPISNSMVEFVGPSHEQGGIPISYFGKKVEVEGGEPAYVTDDGALNIMGNMYVPKTGKKFKTVAKELAKEENKAKNQLDLGMEYINNFSPKDPTELLKFNTGLAKKVGAEMKHNMIEQKKQSLVDIQNKLLAYSHAYNLDPEEFSKGVIKKAKRGVSLHGKTYDNFGEAEKGKTIDPTPEDYKKIVRDAAKKAGIDENVFMKLVSIESSFNPKAKSNAGAIGLFQFMPKTAEEYGITKKQLRSTDISDIQKVGDAAAKHFSKLLKNNNNDYLLALAAYNGGQGAINFVKEETGNKNLTGLDWIKFMEDRQEKTPTSKKSAWQTQTLDYVKTIAGHGNNDNFHDNIAKKYNEKYYFSPPEYNLRKMNPELLEMDMVAPEGAGQYSNNFVGELYKAPMEQLQPKPETQKPYEFYESTKNKPTNQQGLPFSQIAPELYSLATNKVQPVHLQQFTPDLFSPYQVSFQDRLNENQSTFSAMQRAAGNNPSALAALAAQKYQADSGVLGEEFRTNQGILNDVTNRNVALINDSRMKNLGLADQQYVRQSTAQSKTRAQNQVALNSIASKYAQNALENKRLGLYENLYNFRFDPYTGEAKNYNPDQNFEPSFPVVPSDDRELTTTRKFDGLNIPKETTIKERTGGRKITVKKENGGSIAKLYNDTFGKIR